MFFFYVTLFWKLMESPKGFSASKWEYFRNSFGILWEFFGILRESLNFSGFLWEILDDKFKLDLTASIFSIECSNLKVNNNLGKQRGFSALPLCDLTRFLTFQFKKGYSCFIQNLWICYFRMAFRDPIPKNYMLMLAKKSCYLK